ncbi:MAG TPA: hypothetical protein VNF73_05575 [Candidatus Saccharimonadales bacterium]|nr:hypothetical protein [Candidatus Saccharimonadales bacterium]
MFGNNIHLTAVAWMTSALAAVLVSIRPGVSDALMEIALDVAGGDFPGFQATTWVGFTMAASAVSAVDRLPRSEVIFGSASGRDAASRTSENEPRRPTRPILSSKGTQG